MNFSGYVNTTAIESAFIEMYHLLLDYKRSRMGADILYVYNPTLMLMNEKPDDQLKSIERWGVYRAIKEHYFKNVYEIPKSKFSVNIKDEYYHTVKRTLSFGLLPIEKDVQTEELINHFDYLFDHSIDQKPISIHTEINICPWDSTHHLLMVGLDVNQNRNSKKQLISSDGQTSLPLANNLSTELQFNNEVVNRYRLIGYENRLQLFGEKERELTKPENVNTDLNVIALYELVLHDTVRYNTDAANVMVSYETSGSGRKKKIYKRVSINSSNAKPSWNFILSSAVASYSMLLRNSQYKGSATYQSVIDQVLFIPDIEADEHWAEFLELVKKSKRISQEMEQDPF
ncbi:MAG: von Willebrand factor type A domain-containing protein [Bacteroidota bacterium]